MTATTTLTDAAATINGDRAGAAGSARTSSMQLGRHHRHLANGEHAHGSTNAERSSRPINIPATQFSTRLLIGWPDSTDHGPAGESGDTGVDDADPAPR